MLGSDFLSLILSPFQILIGLLQYILGLFLPAVQLPAVQ